MSTKNVTLHDENGNILLPSTKTSRVTDVNGTNLDTLLQQAGQVKSISVNGVTQTIDANGNVNIASADGVGIASVVQTTTSSEDGGTNVITVTKTDNTTSTFSVKNGSKGSTGATGPQGERGPQGDTGVTVEAINSIIHSIDPTATYGADDVAGADAVQDIQEELTELGGEVNDISSRDIQIETFLPVQDTKNRSNIEVFSPSIRNKSGITTYYLPVKTGDAILINVGYTTNYLRTGYSSLLPATGVAISNLISYSTAKSNTDLYFFAKQDGYFCFSAPTNGLVVNTIKVLPNGFGKSIGTALDSKMQLDVLDKDYSVSSNDNYYIRYSDGVNTSASSSAAFKEWVFPLDGIKKIKARLGSEDTVPAAIAFFSSPVNISSSTVGDYMAEYSIQAKTGIFEYEVDVPSGALYAVVTNRGSREPEPEVTLYRDPTYLMNNRVSELEKTSIALVSQDALPTENVLEHYYIRYSDGVKVSAGTFHSFKLYYFPVNNVQKIEATLGSLDNVPAAIAFFSSELNLNASIIGTYMPDVSIQAEVGTNTYLVDVPSNAKWACITNRDATYGTPSIKFYLYPWNIDESKPTLLEHDSDAVDSVIAERVSVQSLPTGTKLEMDVTQLSGDGEARILIYCGSNFNTAKSIDYIPIRNVGKIYFEIKENYDWLSIRKESSTGNVLNFIIREADIYPIYKRVQGVFLPSCRKTIELGTPFRGFYRDEYDVYPASEWVSFPLQKSCGYQIRIDCTDFETYYVEIYGWYADYSGKYARIITESTVVDLTGYSGWNIQFRRQDRAVLVPEEVANVITVTYISGFIYERPVLPNEVVKIIEENSKEENSLKVAREGYSLHLFSNAPHYYHFAANYFITDGNGNKAIASESIEDVALAARLGFAFIEANIQPTSDEKYVCIHGSSGTFGPEVKSVNENVITTEALRSTAINSVTQAWIRENVRYDSYYAKYQTSIPTLEEFCEACKENNIGIFAGTNQRTAIDTCVKYLGNNVIVYGAPNDVRDYFNGYVLHWNNSSGLTISSLLSRAKSFGAPYICSIGPTTIAEFESDGILDDFISTMHANGFLCGFAGVYQTEDETRDLIRRGFDMSGSGHEVNSFDSNYEEFDIDDANHLPTTTGSISNGVVTLASSQTITCGSSNVISVGKGNLFIRFNGTLNINFGSKGVRSGLTSDGTQMFNISDYFFSKNTQLSITAEANTTITHLVYKTSRC